MAVNKVIYDGNVLIDISDSTLTPETLLEGVVAYNAAGERIVGTMKPKRIMIIDNGNGNVAIDGVSVSDDGNGNLAIAGLNVTETNGNIMIGG